MLNIFETSEKESENDESLENKDLKNFANNLKSELLFENNENKTVNNNSNNVDNDNNYFVCPESLLDFLQDKPYKIVDFLFLASQKATKDEIKEIYDLFPINEQDTRLSRPVIKKMIEEFLADKPELAKFFNENNLFYIRLVTRGLEVHSGLKALRESKKDGN